MKNLFDVIDRELIIEAEGRGFLSASGMDSERQEKKYIDPHVGSKEYTHELGKAHKDIPVGSKLRLTGKERIEGKLHLRAINDATREEHLIPASKIHKPGEAPKNKGLDYETQTFERFQRAGITPLNAKSAGSTGGTDVTIVNKKKKTTHKGRIKNAEDLIHGEVKEGVTAAMGQLTIHHDSKQGWHIKDDRRNLRPNFAKSIEDAGIIKMMNSKYNPDKHEIPTTASGRAKSISIKHPNLDPAVHYLNDHHVHVLHVGSGYGTYKVGQKDPTDHGLPAISGKGEFIVREKQAGNKKARTVMFKPDGVKGLNKSHVNLDDDEHLENFAKTLGHR